MQNQISFRIPNSNLINFLKLRTKDKKQGGKTWTFWQQNSMRVFFVGAIAKDFCFLTVGLLDNYMINNIIEIPSLWFCFNKRADLQLRV